MGDLLTSLVELASHGQSFVSMSHGPLLQYFLAEYLLKLRIGAGRIISLLCTVP
jgi:hypothetical protein